MGEAGFTLDQLPKERGALVIDGHFLLPEETFCQGTVFDDRPAAHSCASIASGLTHAGRLFRAMRPNAGRVSNHLLEPMT
jgi:hypothetical protein